ncbi:MAG: CAP domain-containing protein [Solirubrobacterales bacterium]
MTLAPRLTIVATVVVGALALALALLPAAAGAAQCKGGDVGPAKLSNKGAAKAVLCLINKERRRHHLKPLRSQHAQAKAARKHNRRMVRQRCFSHECPGEPDLTGRLTQAGYLPCRCSWGIAENIAYGNGRQGSPREIVDAWMHSPDHRANILNGSYRHIGVAASPGTPFAGRQRDAATYTTDFGYKR